MKNKPTLSEAMRVLQAALSEDREEGSYYYSWQASIAMAFKDEFERHYTKEYADVVLMKTSIHTIANNAAKNFLNMLIIQS